MNTPLDLSPLIKRLRTLVDDYEIQEDGELTDTEALKLIAYYQRRAEDYLEAAELLHVLIRGCDYNRRITYREEVY